jgi:hypothetical protein
MHPLLKKLEGGDRRSIGRTAEVVAAVLADPSLFAVVFNGMLAESPLIRMRCADAVEKITAQCPELLRPHKRALLHGVAASDQPEVRWHVAQLLPRVRLTPSERRAAVRRLNDYLSDESRIVRTLAMQALADLAEQDAALRPPVLKQLEELTRTGSPAMRARGRKLLARLKAPVT